MKLKKALEIIYYYAALMQEENFIKLADIDETELDELKESLEAVKDFLFQFNC